MSHPTKSEISLQWHLDNAVKGEVDLNVLAAWKDYDGSGVKLAVIDDGFDYKNKDLAANYQTGLDRDYGQGDAVALPVTADDNHGTAVMGLAGAAGGNGGVVGVAYGASLIGYRVDYAKTESPFNLDLAAAITDTADKGMDTVNMSLGTGGYFQTDANIDTVIDAIYHATATGRDGLGTILVMAGGNTRQDSEGYLADINGRTFDSQTEMIAVGSVDRDGFVSYFSSYGAPLLVSAPGTGIVTTDRTGSAGYNSAGDITSDRTGTSYSAPMVTGVTALMLEANADLGWRDVQSILAYSARHVGSVVDGTTTAKNELHAWSFNGAGNWNGGGLHYSEDYGYGLVDATAAVRLAETWTKTSTSANQKTVSQAVLTNTATPIPDHDATGVSFSATVSQNIAIERVGVSIDFSAFSAQVAIYLTAPDGQELQLFGGAGLDAPSTYSFEFQSQQYRGDTSAGTWKVRVVDQYVDYDTSVSNITLNFYGAAISRNDTYIYTDEFSDFKSNHHSANLADANSGTDTLNAAAVTAAMTVNLAKSSGRIDGVAMKITGIENVFGGDGRDHLTGSRLANDLSGGRGADVLAGGRGADDFIYRVIRDSTYGKGHDRITDFAGNDRIDLSDIDALAKSGDQAFRFIGAHGFHGKAGELDFRLIDKAGRAHDATMVYADLDGDKHADFQIELSGLHHLVKGDFLL
jgi:subtilisin family serine protease